MLVIADIEWYVKENGYRYPTQIAAIRVNESWDIVAQFSTIIKCSDKRYFEMNPVPFTGYVFERYMTAPTLSKALMSFYKWLNEDDTIGWWASHLKDVYSDALRSELFTTDMHKQLVLNKYVTLFLFKTFNARSNPYELAADRSIITPTIQHKSENDVITVRNLLCGIKFDQSKLKENISFTEETTIRPNTFLFDKENGLFHKDPCPFFPWHPGISEGSIMTAIRKSLKPCDCVKDEYYSTIREHVKSEIRRCGFNFVYIEGSDVFHTPSCKCLDGVTHVLGSKYYVSMTKIGLKPCGVCNPVSTAELFKKPAKQNNPTKNVIKIRKDEQLSLDEKHAIGRLKQAQSERTAGNNNASLSEEERRDMMALSQPGLAFFASRGYKFFHLRNCSVLAELTNIVGFDRFDNAIKTGYKPCRHCNPSRKFDVNISIPITNQKRVGERIDDIFDRVTECGYNGYRYVSQIDNINSFIIETPVGKWRIHVGTRPIIVDHINFVKTPGNTTDYHRQHRMFLSFIDTFDYIKRHDETLMNNK